MPVAAALVAMCLVVAGCGSGDGDHSGTGSETSGQGSDQAVVEAASADLTDLYAGKFEAPPSDGPEAADNKTVWILTCSLHAAACVDISNAAEEAAKELGWDVRVIDGKLSPAVYNQVIRQATAAKVDGLAMVSINCEDAPAAIDAATRAGIKVAAATSEDCANGGFSTYPVYVNGKTSKDILETDIAQARADWLIAELNGEANPMIVTLSDNPIAVGMAAGLRDAFAECSDCEVVDGPITSADLLEGKIQGKVETLLLQNPQVNSLLLDSDIYWTAGVKAAVRASGRDLVVVGAHGIEEAIDEVRSGDIDASGVLFLGWTGWSLIDALNRAFAGEQGPIESGNGYMLVDQAHGLPPEGKRLGEEGPLNEDWKDAYREVWGVQHAG